MKQPPALDDKLTMNALDMLKYAPLLMLFNGYWMLSNRQIFENVYSFIDTTSNQMKSEHLLQWTVNQASPVLLMSLAAVFLIVMQKVFSEQLTRWGFTL